LAWARARSIEAKQISSSFSVRLTQRRMA
jgi:hypothetical protein